jgi:predicted nucleic acid-binding protein
MNVVDSSGWIEFFTDSPNADYFEKVIQAASELIVPTIVIFEVARVATRVRGGEFAVECVAAMTTGKVVDLNVALATAAADLAHAQKLAMADAIILATARQFGATVWTQDVDLKHFGDVRFREKKRAP